MNSVAATYAMRSLTRHSRRSLLSVLGIGIGCAICLFQIAWVRGEHTMMMNAAASGGVGHLCVVPKEWADTRQSHLRLTDWEPILTRLRGHPGVDVATPRVRTDALLAFGTRALGISMTGVEPSSEMVSNRLVHQVAAGSYLADERGTVVIGQGVEKWSGQTEPVL